MEPHTFEWRGQVYRLTHSADLITVEPRKGRPARPYDIPIKGDFGTTSGELGTTKVSVVNEVERVIMFPPRGGAYDRKNGILPRPFYYERDETGKRHKAFKVFCSHCGDYQRRDAFSPDPSHVSGLRRYCKTCEAERARLYYHRQKAKQADKSLVLAA